MGYSIQIDSPSRLQHSINAIENQEARSVISTLAMKAMSQEKYFCTGTFDINRYHHYSLDEPLYTHFVSPTKRYADVVVHRQLEAYINGGKTRIYTYMYYLIFTSFIYLVDFFYMEPEIVQKTAQICNVKSRAAENAKEQTQHMFLSYYLADNTGSTTTKVEDAVVVGVQEGAFDVIVLNYGLERRIHTINLPLKSDTYSPSENVLHLVWIQNQATVDQVVEGNIESDDDDTNVDEELLVDLSDSEDNGRGGKEVHQEGKAVLGSGETNAGGDNQQQLSEAVNRLSIKSVDSGTSLGEKQQRRRSTSIRAIQGEDAWMTQKECKFPNECRQLIRPFDFVKVVITSDPIRSPPLIRVLAANPFINQEN